MTEPAAKPVFGPNGAVMNASAMTPEMRGKLDESSRLPTWKKLFSWASLIGGLVLWGAAGFVLSRMGDPTFPHGVAWTTLAAFVVLGAICGLVSRLIHRR